LSVCLISFAASLQSLTSSASAVATPFTLLAFTVLAGAVASTVIAFGQGLQFQGGTADFAHAGDAWAAI
jgi:hypothetical protein